MKTSSISLGPTISLKNHTDDHQTSGILLYIASVVDAIKIKWM
jgi:hypothetical protein